jgi:tetratricopeptide (TPR) repeat protein
MRTLAVLTTLALAGALPSSACIQTMRMLPPRDPAQLPADLFKLHIDIKLSPLTIDLPLLGGQTPVTLTRETRDAQGDFNAIIRAFEAAADKAHTDAERNDYAAALLFAGRFSDAVPVLEALERDHPGQYATASNLGTAYELVGDLDQAKVWIAKGVERNPESHVGTEWLHLAILDTKQKLKTDPNWLRTHSVFDGVKDRSRAEIAHALEYQLNERLYFIRHDDLVMCDLMYQAAVTTDDAAKRAYFLKQVSRFGPIRDYQVRKLTQG